MKQMSVSLPSLNERDLQLLLAGLDELPGKLSRELYTRILTHIRSQVAANEQKPAVETQVEPVA